MARATLAHLLHDVGIAAWFGGTLANAVALNKAASSADTAGSTGAVANEGWDRWTPVNAAAIGVHLAGAAALLKNDYGRMKTQDGVATMAVAKTTLTAAALAVTGYSRLLGQTISREGSVPAADGTTPTASTPPHVAAAQKKLQALQWVVPALTGGIVAVSAYASEQFRPEEVTKGVLSRVIG
ncbi:hypothetical protein [Rhodococcus sp. MEB064]|uniref:hypothetical protein n=1 Tax=Rhodococcus sp. MEB064 TaxID=1587522 RepID=UPI0005ACC917|nr:hypothetical protein [Rhodococcus sp. MEB064]KIQ17572.1 hypothetical protein RU01_10505 [Rhodococcus sp. MEB064]